jgi:3-methyladenine DNA glycosylase AlkC
VGEPFKNLVSPASARRLAEEIAAANPGFDGEGFVAAASRGLEVLELKARVRHVGEALRPFLAPTWTVALEQVLAASPPEEPNHEGVTSHFHWWPALDLVERQGLGHVEASVGALMRLTTRFTAEYAVRPYLAAAPEVVWPMLERWVEHPDLGVRRWVSEGTRPRLPWGMRLVADPSRGIRVIERLVDDPSSYVRRSVANHLGDVAKDDPELAVATAARWMRVPARRRLVEHALRSLLKSGHAGALALVGGEGAGVRVDAVEVTPGVASVGDTVEVRAELLAATPGAVRVDVVWAWPGARSGWSRKVFRGKSRELGEGERWTFRHRLSLRPVSTRPMRPGEQRVTLRINGEDVATVGFAIVG